MHGSPSCAITVSRFGVWRAAVVAVSGAAMACLVAWLLTSPQGESAWARAGIAAGVLCIIGLAISLWRMQVFDLRWDGNEWWLAVGEPSAPPATGTMEVAIDLGVFLLLRFAPVGRPGPAVRWIPVGRAGLEREWHAFRCAVYSPRPAAGPSAADRRLP